MSFTVRRGFGVQDSLWGNAIGKIYDNCVRIFIYLQREQWLGEILWLNELLVKMIDEQPSCPVYSRTLMDGAVWVQIIFNWDMCYWCCPSAMYSVGRTTSTFSRFILPVKIDLIKSTIWCLFSNPNLHNVLEWTFDRQGGAGNQPLKKMEIKWPSQQLRSMIILVTGLLFIPPLAPVPFLGTDRSGEDRGKSSGQLQVASPSFMLMLSTGGEWCTENEYSSTLLAFLH